MKVFLFGLTLLLYSKQIKAQVFLIKKIHTITIYYINPSYEFFSGTKVHEVINYSKDNMKHNTRINEISYYCHVKQNDKIDSIRKMFKTLDICRGLEVDDAITNNVRIVLKIRYGFLKKPAYVFLTGIDNQNIIFENYVYKSNKNFYAYIMSLWPTKIKLDRNLEDGICDISPANTNR